MIWECWRPGPAKNTSNDHDAALVRRTRIEAATSKEGSEELQFTHPDHRPLSGVPQFLIAISLVIGIDRTVQYER